MASMIRVVPLLFMMTILTLIIEVMNEIFLIPDETQKLLTTIKFIFFTTAFFYAVFDPMGRIQTRRIGKKLQKFVVQNQIPNGSVLNQQGFSVNPECTAHQAMKIQEWIEQHQHLQSHKTIFDEIKQYFYETHDIFIENDAIVRDKSKKEICRFKIPIK